MKLTQFEMNYSLKVALALIAGGYCLTVGNLVDNFCVIEQLSGQFDIKMLQSSA